MSIKKYYEFINEDELEDEEPEQVSDPTDPKNFAQSFAKFKEFLDRKAGKEPAPIEMDPSVTSGRMYSAGSGDFSNIDKMIELVVKYLNKHGITNPLVQRAILATIGKESGFTSTKEASYKNTSPARIRQVFGSRFANLSDEEIETIKKDDKVFWEKVYGGDWGKKYLGNIQPGDGAKYVGRGFNGITGRSNYQTYTNMLRKAGTNADLIQNPEMLERSPDLSAEVNALYFLRGLSDPIIKRKYGNSDPNDFQDFQTALKAVVNANAGPGTDINRGFAKTSYDSAIAANSKFGSKFDKAVSGDLNRTA